MNLLALLNRDGGTLKTMDCDELAALIRDEFQVQGHQVEVKICDGSQIVDAIEKAARRTDIDALIVGGGDGTVSAAASALVDGEIALGILPAGTMNLFARTLQVPLDLNLAIAALASGAVTRVDYGTVNGKPFLHQFAVGMHARMVRLRDKISYGSRVGKIWATTRAMFAAIRRLPNLDIEITVDGVRQDVKTPAVAVSNNLYGDGHMPYADNPVGGTLGVYICTESRAVAMSRLTFDIMMGNWRINPNLKVLSGRTVTFEYKGRHHKNRAVCDGELMVLEERTKIELHARGLSVLVPTDARYHDKPEASTTRSASNTDMRETAAAQEPATESSN